MHHDQYEREMKARYGLDEQYVLPILKCSEDDDLCGRWTDDAAEYGYSQCGFGIVMEEGERNFMVILMQEALNLDEQRDLFRGLIRAIAHLHSQSLVHADIKPLNALRMADGTVRLIDFDATISTSSFVGAKTSTAYMGPELTVRLADGSVVMRTYKLDSANREVPDGDFELCRASPSFDFWSLGCVLFRALARRPLFNGDDRDNVRNANELLRVHEWDEAEVDHAMSEIDAELRQDGGCSTRDRLAACDLVAWLLQPNPARRPSSAEEILGHAFFNATGGTWKMSPLHVASALGHVRDTIRLLGAKMTAKLSVLFATEAEAALTDHSMVGSQNRRSSAQSILVAGRRVIQFRRITQGALGTDGGTLVDDTVSSEELVDLDNKLFLSKEHLLGMTPLHLAVVNLQCAGVELLLCIASVGKVDVADELVSFRKATQRSSFRVASGCSRVASSLSSIAKTSKTLLNRCVNALDNQKQTPLHALLKTAEGLRPAEIDSAMHIIKILADLTDPLLGDNMGKTVFDIGCASPVKRVCIFFASLRAAWTDQKRHALFKEMVLAPDGGVSIEPWSLEAGKLQEWLRARLQNASQRLTDIVDAMGNIDGFTLLSECIEVNQSTEKGIGTFNNKKLKKHLVGLKKSLAIGSVKELLKIFGPESTGYYRAVLLSCVTCHGVCGVLLTTSAVHYKPLLLC